MKKNIEICTLMDSVNVFVSESYQIKSTENSQVVTGNFNSQGMVCIEFDISAEHYVRGTVFGMQKLVVQKDGQQHIRTLFTNSPIDAHQSIAFTVPQAGKYRLVAKGKAGELWQFTLSFPVYIPRDNDYGQQPESPRLKQLQIEVAAGKGTEAFWQEITCNGAPLFEDYDSKNKRVTFLWRGAKANVFIFGAPSHEHDPMSRLAGTDVWFRSYIIPSDTLMQYKLAPDLPLVEGAVDEQRRSILITAQADPLNKNVVPEVSEDVFNHDSLLALRPVLCDVAQLKQLPFQGNTKVHQFESKILGNCREISIYQPVIPMKQPAMLVLFDGVIYRKQYYIDRFFDSLIEAGKIPPMYVVFVDSLDNVRRGQELPPNPDFAAFMANELMPWLATQGIEAPARHTIISGSSYGGLASSWVAFNHPELFGNVLSMSGSYWWAPKGEAPEWLIREFAKAEKKPLRFYLQAGLLEARDGLKSILHNNRHLKETLLQKGYPVESSEISSGHNYIAWCETLYYGTKSLVARW
ncbi:MULTISPECIES: alpha/beta hydrolase-fold protein [Photorhabdus]|uniref:Similarities with enterochelin esterase fes n=2 Tax=Photorhabdus asymbiotica TaxID=291112 RepID=C7BJQ6_PHOAA|nr:alpha/beta hydrolase-fold protein [Photorhabdus asymbiotica]RKS58093.1 enterochelin esterase family protein [Photorhabdus asymbiotica]CAQ82572.1 similarities with enterochelin esterase fes [Photorhabdus asymbiotica]